jgi:biotin transport system substrate-specific component
MVPVISLEVSRQLKVKSSWLTDIALILAGSLFVAAMSQLVVFLPFSPVPITAQTFAVLLVGAVLGSRRGGLSLLFYLAEGGLGLPFFSGGRAGLAMLVGPTGGYLVGFVAAAVLVGWLAERGWDRKFACALLAFALGNLIIYAFGVLQLSTWVGFEKAIAAGVLPFLAGDGIRILLAAVALPSAWKLVNNLNQ